MNIEVLTSIAVANSDPAALHHLLFILGIVFLWLRRDLGRAPSVLFAAAFGTSAWLLLTSTGARFHGAVASLFAALWIVEIVRPVSRLNFHGVRRPRSIFCLATFVYALLYPGYTPGLPLVLFAPLGVLLPPTLLAAISLLNVAAPSVRPLLHWAHVIAGLVFGVWGIVLGQWLHAPLVAAAVYGLALILRGAAREEDSDEPEGSVRDIQERMYSRRTLLPGPTKYGRRIRVGSRKKRGGRNRR